jgi:hypothetical protein
MTHLEKLIKEYINVPGDIQRHINAVTYDLYYGPLSADIWRAEDDNPDAPLYSFENSISVITDFFDELPTFFYCEWTGTIEKMDDDENMEINREVIKLALFGRELSAYI